MLKKRIAGVITVRNGWAVQSLGYARYLPLGRPEWLAENLDRWGADEIIVLSIDRTRRALGPDLELLRRLGALGLPTPLTFGGGIRTVADAGSVIQSGADRICLDPALWSDAPAVRKMAALLGSQALIGVLPLALVRDEPSRRDYLSGTDIPVTTLDLSLFGERVVSEALIVDWRNEGRPGGFDMALVERFPLDEVPLIAFGGISTPDQMARLFADERVVACAVGNFLSYREHAVQRFRRALPASPIRPAEFRAEL
jgi:imidazole glycerol-phosphate synthase subunit HisF